MRKLTEHHINPANEEITIQVLDEPADGGANHRYRLQVLKDDGSLNWCSDLDFQKGPIQEVGTNGITNESLLVIVLDRMRSFQKGDYACRENALVITKLEEALHWLHHRTRERERRGVEGTSEP